MRDLSDTARDQVPFATSLAINATLDDVEKNSVKHMRKAMDRPTPFTLKANAKRRASKRNLSGVIFVKDAQASYLQWLETGGTRGPKKRAIPIARSLRLNKYGNMPKGSVARTLAGPNVFSGTPKGGGQPGIYRRLGATADKKAGHQLDRVVDYVRSASYQPRLGWKRAASKTANAQFPVHFWRAMRRALSTAR